MRAVGRDCSGRQVELLSPVIATSFFCHTSDHACSWAFSRAGRKAIGLVFLGLLGLGLHLREVKLLLFSQRYSLS